MLCRSLPPLNAASAAAVAARAIASASALRRPFPSHARTFALSRLKREWASLPPLGPFRVPSPSYVTFLPLVVQAFILAGDPSRALSAPTFAARSAARPAAHSAARSAAAPPFLSAHSDALVRTCARASSSAADSQQQQQQQEQEQQQPATAMSGAGAESLAPAVEAAMAATRAQGGADESNGVDSILSFWFGDWARPANAASMGSVDYATQTANQALWFRRNAEVDEFIRTTFSPLMAKGLKGELAEWETTPHGALALTVLLDQFPRNSFRGSPKSFEMDPMARQVVSRAIEKGFDKVFKGSIRGFFYLPFMHSEDLADQNRSVALYEAMVEDSPDERSRASAANMLKFAEGHRAPIQQFGRFPHRNAVLGRSSTDAEESYLAAGGGFG